MGGSIFGRFGFSDVLTAFLALDTKVELYRGGIIPLEEFVKMPRDRDILVRLIVKKTSGTFAYLSHRNARTDFPVLAVGMSLCGKQARISVGARPQKAMAIELSEAETEKIREGVCSEEELAGIAQAAAEKIPTGSNMRAGSEYRSHLCGVLIRRGLMKLQEGGGRHED